MDVIGSIDNAAGMLTTLGKQRFHLVFTRSKLVILIPMSVREAVSENTVSGGAPPVGVRSARMVSSMIREEVVHTMEDKGKEIEENLDSFLSSNRDKVRFVDYTEISSAKLLKGNPFKLPRLIIRTDDSEMYFYLHHNNYVGTGKLDKDVYERYRSVLEKALGEDKVSAK